MWVMVPLAVAALLSGCAAAPRAVLQVPGTYVANLWEPTIDGPYGNAAATVVMCLDTESAVLLETGEGSEGAVGSIRLTWAGVVHESSAFREATTLTTPVLQPGCGLLTFGVDCCHVDHYLAIRATKV
jgi:hypothetical protein